MRKSSRAKRGLILVGLVVNLDQCHSPVGAVGGLEWDHVNLKNTPESSICLNTLKTSLSLYTDSDIRAIPRWKTGKKDKESAWAKARLATATQMKKQVALGKKIDAGDLLLSDAMKECRDRNAPPPIWINGTVFVDENHVEVQDRQIKICGENNNLVHKRYRNCLPADGPEFMPLDNHLFGDLQEGASKNVALTSFLHKNDDQKYSFATPKKVYSALQRTIKKQASLLQKELQRIVRECLRRH
jgi:hypothetical protein